MTDKIQQVVGKPRPNIRFYHRILNLLGSKLIQYFILFLITGSIASIIISSFREITPLIKVVLFLFTNLASLLFMIEYILRIISAPALFPHLTEKRARLNYLLSFFGFVDFVALLPFILTYLYWETPMLHLIILTHIFIIFKLIRYSKALHIIGRALRDAREELIAAYTICGIMICFSAILMYYTENKAQPDAFANIGDGLWWAMITFTTVGYGDVYPVTVLGKILGGAISLIGIGMIALPTGIISSAFMNVIQEKKKKDGKSEK